MYCCYIVPWYQGQCGIDSSWIKHTATSSHLWQQGCTWHSSSRPLGRRWVNTIQITTTCPHLNMWLLLASNALNSCSMKVILRWKKLITVFPMYISSKEGLWKYPCLPHMVSGNALCIQSTFSPIIFGGHFSSIWLSRRLGLCLNFSINIVVVCDIFVEIWQIIICLVMV